MKRLAFTILILILFAFPSTALADVAPPINPPGSNPQPGSETTQVRMVAETVLIDVQKDTTPDSLGRAHVTADFTMHNLGNTAENMAVRFPISANDGRDQYPEITNVIIKVNGKQVSYRRASYPELRYQSKDVPWAEFDITFPAGQDVPIQVSYDLNGSGYAPYAAFYYILETGAGWKGTIGSADIILRLPYPASTQNVIMDLQIGWAETTPKGVFQANEVRWHFENFEPGPDGPVQNMEFALVSPAAWQSVLTERDNVEKNPNDSEAWGRLAKAYKQIFLMNKGYRTDTGGEELYNLSIEAYQKCLSLKPNDAQWHAGFADLLASRSYWDSSSNGGPTADTYRAFEEIHTALQLAPNDPKVLEIAQNISYMFPNGISQNGNSYDFPWLTATPLPPTPAPTIVPFLDPVAVSGVYLSDMLTLSNNQRVQLTLTLHADYSAELESKYDNNQTIISSGSWIDNRDGTLGLVVTDPNNERIVIMFNVKKDLLHAYNYPSSYGQAGIEMKRLVTAAPIPALTDTPQTSATTPAQKPSSPICGTAALVPLAALLWLRRKRR